MFIKKMQCDIELACESKKALELEQARKEITKELHADFDRIRAKISADCWKDASITSILVWSAHGTFPADCIGDRASGKWYRSTLNEPA